MQKINKRILQLSQYQKFGCSKDACNYMFGEKNSATVIHNAIELEKFKYNDKKRVLLREKYGIENDTIVIGFIGRIQYQKNPIFLIKIFEEFYKMYHDSRIDISRNWSDGR